MTPHKRQIGNVFDPSIRLVVPLFQRPYVWEREKNWEPLWESVADVAERRLSGEPRTHFLGAVVLDQLKTSTGDVESRQIIDGQQRMTTFQVALAGLRDLCRGLGEDRHFRAFDKLTSNDVPLSDDPDDAFKVWPTNVDRDLFRTVMTAGSPGEVRARCGIGPKRHGPTPPPLLADAYLYFHEASSEWLGSPSAPEFQDRLKALYHAIRSDLLVVVIDLDEHDDAQVIFETMNALGTPLLPADLIKNFLFQSNEIRREDKGRAEALYDTYWKPFDDDAAFWRKEVRQGRLLRPRVDLFLQYYLTVMKGDEVPATHLFAEFRDYARRRPELSPADHLRSIREYGAIYKRFVTGYGPDTPEGRFFRRLGELDTTTFFPLLLELFRRAEGTPPDEIRGVLADLESFLIRRMVCRLTTKNYNRLVQSLIQRLRGRDDFPAAEVRDFLLSQESDAGRWPPDGEFRERWAELPFYLALSRARVRVVLGALEAAMFSGKTERVVVRDDALTIEHVMPQEWEGHWPLPGDLPPGEAEQRREWLIHTIGNLTLVTGKLNPAMSNAGWPAKRAALAEHSALAMNRRLASCGTWGEGEIRARTEELFALALKTWPRPASPAAGSDAAATVGEPGRDAPASPVGSPATTPRPAEIPPRPVNPGPASALSTPSPSPGEAADDDRHVGRPLRSPDELRAVFGSNPELATLYAELKRVEGVVVREDGTGSCIFKVYLPGRSGPFQHFLWVYDPIDWSQVSWSHQGPYREACHHVWDGLVMNPGNSNDSRLKRGTGVATIVEAVQRYVAATQDIDGLRPR